jgi:hypothetical protein
LSGVIQATPLVVIELLRLFQRRQPGAMQDLVRVLIADAAQDRRIE